MGTIRNTLAVLVLVAVPAGLWAGAPSGRYTVTADTAKDNKTGLTWQRGEAAQTADWAAARSFCTGLSLGGFTTGWRLPEKKELETLVDRRARGPAIDGTAFPNTSSERFWTATAYAASPGVAWYVNFDDGSTDAFGTSTRARVRCVR